MAVDIKPEHVAVAGGIAIAGAVLLMRKPAAPGGAVFTVTGPSEGTARELIRAGTESERIESRRQVDLADVFTSAEVSLARFESEERRTELTLTAQERIAAGAQATQRAVAESFAGVQRAQVAAQEQNNFLGFLGNIIAGVFGL